MSLKENIKHLSMMHGVSGFEHSISDYLSEQFKALGFELSCDAMGNIIALKKSSSGSGRVMIEAHIDEIGFVVKSVDKDGFLRIAPIGGVDARILYGSTVVVHSDCSYVGIVGAKPPHMMDDSEYGEKLDFDNLFVDVGMTSDEVAENIPLGSVVTFQSEYTKLLNSNISSKSLDDRASVAILLECANRFSKIDLGYDLYICGTVQEEVGMRGATTAAYSINPDIAIAIDVTHAITPDESKYCFKPGCGPVVCKGPNIHPVLVNEFLKVLNYNKIPYEIEVEGGNTGTDAWSIQTARCGIPTMLLSIPLKYMHTPIESLSLDDCDATVEALCAFLKSFERTEDVLC